MTDGPVSSAPASLVTPQVAPAAAPQGAAPVAPVAQEAAPSFNPLSVASVMSDLSAGLRTDQPRNELGQFSSNASPADDQAQASPDAGAVVADPNPPMPQPDSEPHVDLGAEFGKVPLSQVPQFLESMVTHKTNDLSGKLAAIQAQAETAMREREAFRAREQEASSQLDQLISWGRQNPQGLLQFLSTLPAQPAQQMAPQQPQGQYLTQQQVQEQFNQMWQAKQQEAAAKAQAEAQAAAEKARVQNVANERLKPIIGSLPESIQKLVKEQIGARMHYDQSLVNAPEAVVIQRMVAIAQGVVNDLNGMNAARVEAQKKVAQSAAPIVNGGATPTPSLDRSGFDPLNHKSVFEDMRADLGRLRGM